MSGVGKALTIIIYNVFGNKYALHVYVCTVTYNSKERSIFLQMVPCVCLLI